MDCLSILINQQGFCVIDGGLATLLELHGHNLKDELWSAKLLYENPQAIKNAHLEYLDSGADVIISSSYQASLKGFFKKGFSEDQSKTLLGLSAELILEARNEWWTKNQSKDPNTQRIRPLVAISMGAFGASLADGSEFRGDYSATEEELVEYHSEKIELILNKLKNNDTKPDLWAFETIPCLKELQAITKVLLKFPTLKAWISFSCKDGKSTCSGDSFEKCVEFACKIDQIVAVGVNCTSPEYISELADIGLPFCKNENKNFIAYPNSGEKWDAEEKKWIHSENPQEDIDTFARNTELWYEKGVKAIGGCCQTNTTHINSIRTVLSLKQRTNK
eukprot:c17720_g1_i1.p1 GENE.c17720_g1_i1~~c17720_g1_i1.p1  ORF type:complete len:334 (-),score=118.56 c17720_g1_i1:39-1040(-)